MACMSGTFELNRPLQLSQILFRPNWPFQNIFSKYISKIECQNTFQREMLLLDLLASHLLKECLPNLATPASVSSSSFQHWKARASSVDVIALSEIWKQNLLLYSSEIWLNFQIWDLISFLYSAKLSPRLLHLHNELCQLDLLLLLTFLYTFKKILSIL